MANLVEYDVLSMDCKNPPYDGQNLTNRVLIKYENLSDGNPTKKIAYYCPVYVRMKVKNFSEMNLTDLSAEVNIVLTITFNLKNIPALIQDDIKKRIVLRFNRDEPISLGSSKSEQISVRAEDDEGLWTYTIRKILHAGMIAKIFFSPFEIINLILTIKFQKAHINKEDLKDLQNKAKIEIKQLQSQKKKSELDEIEMREIEERISQIEKDLQYLKYVKHIVAQFNLMDCTKNKYVKISYSEEGTFGNYDLAEQRLDVQYTNQELSSLILAEKEKEKQAVIDHSSINQFQNAHFTIPLYKFPLVTLFTIFIPLWLLGIINLGIFYQDTGLADRIGSISALMISFIALIPVIRQALPPNPQITVVQVFVYLEIITTLLCFIESVIVRGNSEYVFTPYNNGLYIASLIINMVEIFCVVVAMAVHKCYFQRTYNKRVGQMGDLRFQYQSWNNIFCDQHFKRSIDNGTIKVLKNLQVEHSYLKSICAIVAPEDKGKGGQVKKQQKSNNKGQKK